MKKINCLNNSNLEIWKQIDDYPDCCVSNLGNFKSVIHKANGFTVYDKPYYSDNRKYVILGDKRKYEPLAHLVASLFVENPKNLPYVGFKDGNPLNCAADNLYWTYKRFLNSPSVFQYDLDGNLIKEYECAKQAAIENSLNQNALTNYCISFKKYKGYYWSYSTLSDDFLESLKCKNEKEITAEEYTVLINGHLYLCNDVKIVIDNRIKNISSMLDGKKVEADYPQVFLDNNGNIKTASVQLLGYKRKKARMNISCSSSGSIVEMTYPNGCTFYVGNISYFFTKKTEIMDFAESLDLIYHSFVKDYDEHLKAVYVECINIKEKKQC